MDYAASTPVDPEVKKAMMPYFSEKFGNASTLYKLGQEAHSAIETARKSAAELINAEQNEIIFTSGGTESCNMIIKGLAFANKDKKHIITSKIEHPAVLDPIKWLEKNFGYKVTYLNVDKYGIVDLCQLEKSITQETLLVSVMHANNEIGTIEPVEEIGKMCKKHNIIFHTDAIQTFGKIPINVKEMNIDLLSASSHKIYGPKGAGLVYASNNVKIEPLISGGGQEKRLRSGTENTPDIVGFGIAINLRKKDLKKDFENETRLRNMLINEILAIPESRLNGHLKQRLSFNTNFWFKGIEGEAIVMMLDKLGISASTGSACSSTSLEPSHVLTAIGLDEEQAHGSLRLTIGKHTTEQDIKYVAKSVADIVKKLRKMSPTWED